MIRSGLTCFSLIANNDFEANNEQGVNKICINKFVTLQLPKRICQIQDNDFEANIYTRQDIKYESILTRFT